MTPDTDEQFSASVRQRLEQARRLPEATYRLQFHAGFTFRDACAILPYLRELGITHCYASPYLKARPGSTHGYDITDHRLLNPEVGSNEDYAAWIAALRDNELGQILDIVPNHMGVGGNANAWWNDVLENGPAAVHAGYFDIAWQAPTRPALRDRVLLPVLGEPYGAVLEAGQLRLGFEAGGFNVHYFTHCFPLDPCSYAVLLSHDLPALEHALGANDPSFLEYQSILTALGHLPQHTETAAEKIVERCREKEVIKRRLAALADGSGAIREFVTRTLDVFNGRPGESHSFDLLDKLLNEQAYRLSYWRVASDEINYRRFFDVNELAALSMEREEVFAAAHELIFRMLRNGEADGLRIDHPDGLYDPQLYLERLQHHYVALCARAAFEADPNHLGRKWDDADASLRAQLAALAAATSNGAPPLYVVVEKILGAGEALPADWPVYGTSGYDFLNAVNGLFVDAGNATTFSRLYGDWIAADMPFAEMVYQKKLLILQVSLASELHMLAHQLDGLAQANRWSRDFTLNALGYALREIIACFPVYRSYIAGEIVHEDDRRAIELAVRRAARRNPTLSKSLFRFVRDMLLLKYPEAATAAGRAEQRRFAGKFQQVTAPVMAKGVEDTAFYNYARLLSLNEVGGDPARFGTLPEALHRYHVERQARWPWSLSPLSTHDTKRGEDVRARLNVLSELPAEWRDGVARWSKLNEPHRQQADEAAVPDPNEEYFLYQTLIGAWPLEPYDPQEYAAFVERIQAYMLKALYEAKVHTSWINPDAAYDEAVRGFVARILDPGIAGAFLNDFRTFQRRISHYGLLNGLSQTLLRITAPGVPDTYQGTELWNFSLVDPDNRQPVDYARRRQMLRALREGAESIGQDRRAWAHALVESREDGRAKLYLTWQALRYRRGHPGLCSTGEYQPVEATGARRGHVFSFARRKDDAWAVTVVPRLLARLIPAPGSLPLGREVWQDTRLALAGVGPHVRFRNVFTGELLAVDEKGGPVGLAVADVLAGFPVALLVSEA
jgi:(1->4)-alpha-D-glucan 1-alpha-D-glucosylmutase